MLKREDIFIRDPFILAYNQKYYMYAQNFPHGFKAYVSEDLENWEEPVEIIRFPEGFWATKNFWAPEVHVYEDHFYLFVSLYSDTRNRGTRTGAEPVVRTQTKERCMRRQLSNKQLRIQMIQHLS